MLWLCIQLPKLPLEALVRAHRAGDDAPLAVTQNSLIIEANNAAYTHNIEPGLSIATACAYCAELQLLDRDREREEQLLQHLAQWAYSFTPVVSPRSAESEKNQPDSNFACLYLEISGSLKAHRGLAPLLQQLGKELHKMRISHSMGLGHSPSAAHLLSQLPEHRQWLAETRSAPTPQQWRQWISFAPSKFLDCSHTAITKLYACGIKRVSQLLAIPLSEVGGRFGHSFIDYLARLNGTRPDPIPSFEPPAEFDSELFFPSPLDNSEQLLFPAGRLVRELCRQLQRRQLYSQRLCWTLDYGSRGSQQVTVDISQPLLDPQRLIALTKLQFERVTLKEPVQALALKCQQLQAIESHSLREDFFDEGSKQHESYQLIDKLKARLGHQALSAVTLKESYLPEQAWQNADSLTLHSKARGHQLTPVHAPRPNWLLSRPDRIQQRDHKLFYDGELRLLQGPERIDGYWWQHHRHARDYYIARGEQGSLYWVFQDLTSEHWFLHGVYS
ncbi:DNA polymerase Y family protein [Microbulbifer salipaludis]|uniref:DNA polymerase Y family protein n=1 Tax=Microbulbifer salipaludis TaxID=187980 RepID=A0ABS3EAG4_9GAMM|nr:DNA polymerase Y family protein [Microbulbifer salipaludis]MBN8432286.1 DNA polymerase Y family protein [Microbulbifer salipaludis]